MISEKLAILRSFLAKRWTLACVRSQAALARRQQKLLKQLMALASQNFPFYAKFAGVPFAQWPIVDKAVMLQHFGAMNAHGLSRETAWNIAEAGLRSANSSGALADLTIGTSTGTSGQRGLFVVSAQERALWLGAILARCLPDFPFKKHRVAVMLATGNDLYATAKASGRLAFSFFDLKKGVLSHAEALKAFAPDVLIAPPKAVRALAEAGLALNLSHIFTGGEVLDPLDAAAIERWFKIAPRSLYQSTEGFLGVACKQGHIHLNEDDMLFEQEAVPGHPDHFVPVITDLRRRAQAMIRYRLNDMLVKLPHPCPCGSPLLALKRIEGRCDDVLNFPAPHGEISIMPESLRAIILDADRDIADFRLTQTAPQILTLALPNATPLPAQEKAKAALLAYLASLDANPVEINLLAGIDIDHARKLRRISRAFTE